MSAQLIIYTSNRLVISSIKRHERKGLTELYSVNILPPISGRDIMAIGKNYSAHAKEFNASGYDASDKVDMPSHPVVFTKRATSIIANEEDILLHENFTEKLDYEGEIGVIIGKAGFQISEADASEYIWGYTIINDVTAREKQRDHKQFYIGKFSQKNVTYREVLTQNNRKICRHLLSHRTDRCTSFSFTKSTNCDYQSEW